ncbi:MAG: Gfo/Idh/MocA family oxidoreductase [Verrucomicrobiales bacterium]|nr:Gfo/Idh/MocA family oxidoreductase [Verrucomicrobiales bacterium]
MLNIGIIGTGFMTVQHLKAYRGISGARVAALCNPSGRHLDGDFSQVAGNVGDKEPLRLDMTQVKAFRDPAALFADPDIHAVDICTPTRTHVDLSLAALAAGKHVLLEKPMARTPADARRIADAAEAAARRGVFLMPAMCIRFWPEYAWVRERVISGVYGRVLDARFRRVASAPAWGHGHFLQGGESGGALMDLHIHDVDFIQHCFGRPHSVMASGYSKVSGAVDHVVALFGYPGGPTVSAEGSWAMADGFGFNMAFTVNFEKATVDYDLSRGADAFRVAEAGTVRTVSLSEPDGYAGELRHFVESISLGKAPDRVSARDAATALEIAAAEEESVKTGRPVTLG